MSHITVPSVRPRRALLGAGLLAAGLLVTSSAAPAHAALARCGSDPIVYLSNGMKVDLTATLATDRANVKQIAYQLHVPAGARATRVVYTTGELGRKEVVTVVDDAAGPYVTDSIAETYSAAVPVGVTMSVLDQSSGAKGEDSAAGQTPQTLITQVAASSSAPSAPATDD